MVHMAALRCTVFAIVICAALAAPYLTETECPTAPSVPQDRRTDKTTLRVATYNAEWLFLYYYSGSKCPGTGCAWNSTEIAELHMHRVARELALLDADIVNIVEVEGCTTLTDLNNLLASNYSITTYRPYLLTGTDTATGQNVGILTKIDPSVDLQRSAARGEYPQPGSQCGYSQTGTQGVSKHYYTTFDVTGLSQPLTMIGLHFLAFPTEPDRCAKREAQAWVIQQIESDAINQGNHVIVLGDMNDYDATVADPAGSEPTSRVLQMLKDPIASQTGNELLNAASFVALTSNRYSSWYNFNDDCTVTPAELTLIDHIVVSNSLKSNIADAFMDHSYSGRCNSLNSDHWPVIVDIDTTD